MCCWRNLSIDTNISKDIPPNVSKRRLKQKSDGHYFYPIDMSEIYNKESEMPKAKSTLLTIQLIGGQAIWLML